MRTAAWVAIILSLAAMTAQADLITVSGDVSGTWAADTVMVVGEVRVPAGQALTIQPGVQVRFTGRYKFIVQGTLTASGTPADSILFTRHYPTEESKWRGLRFDAANSASSLEYCRLEWAKGDGPYPDVRGGAVWIKNCSPTVRHCTLANNYSHNANQNGTGAGISLDENSTSLIEYNHILLNTADSGGGIFVGWGSYPTIRGNLIENNQANSGGGGIYVGAHAESFICDNVFRNNHSGGYGGGGLNLWSSTIFYGTYSYVWGNLFAGNTATSSGGGVYSRYDTSRLWKNTFTGNQAGQGGGLFVITYANIPPLVHSSIFWGNTGSQIGLEASTGSAVVVDYCDVQGGWTGGSGIINQDPLFLDPAQDDYRLAWGSPGIDTGLPDSLDGDGTRADMGAYFYDQSAPLRLALTPHNAPLQVPAGGGSFDFDVRLSNHTAAAQNANLWCDVALPNGSAYGPVLGPVTAAVPAGATLTRLRTQNVPAAAPGGPYLYRGWAVAGGDTSQDAFPFVKAGAGESEAGSGWFSTGEPFPEANQPGFILQPSAFILTASPNPFNPITALGYRLPAPGSVQIRVYDTAGREVAALVNGWKEAGSHEVTFDGSGLASGVYLVRMEAGGGIQTQKLILLK